MGVQRVTVRVRSRNFSQGHPSDTLGPLHGSVLKIFEDDGVQETYPSHSTGFSIGSSHSRGLRSLYRPVVLLSRGYMVLETWTSLPVVSKDSVLLHTQFTDVYMGPVFVSLTTTLFQKRTLPYLPSLMIRHLHTHGLLTSIQTHTAPPSRRHDLTDTPFSYR